MTALSILRPVNGSDYEIAISDTSTINLSAFTKPRMRIKTDSDCYIKLGLDNSVTVSGSDYDMVILAGELADMALGGAKYVAIMRLTADGTAYINQWENKVLA